LEFSACLRFETRCLEFTFMDSQIILRLFCAVVLGGLIGLEREMKRREAGLQTYSLVALGSCIFTVAAVYFLEFLGQGVDLARVIQAVAIGIGFIGAGTIFKEKRKIEGLTTAAGLWVVAGIGVLAGAGFLFLAALATFFSLLILIGFGFIEKRFFKD
jgi:putative Mg2+ transporter-C (MgtC) family protein